MIKRVGPITRHCFPIVSRVETRRDETEDSDTFYKQQFPPFVKTPFLQGRLIECLSLTNLTLGWSPFKIKDWKQKRQAEGKKGCGGKIRRSSSVGAAKLGLQKQLNLLYRYR
mmetsp:Transcript_7297/g.17821  ORF Transcript_7297/g.17821 Transcript_7297/m.17821 type:complete len:112 (+) Transcript_7297:1375-1710(+)